MITLNGVSFSLGEAAIEQILDLRWRILRAGLAFEAARFEGDLAPTTRHFAAVRSGAEEDGDGKVVCCATFVSNTWEGEPAWQLRGMATDAEWQGMGLGGALLQFAENSVAEESMCGLLWCNARIGALRFYQRHGWQVASEEFVIPTAGPHRKMVKRR